ncbi:MAG: hypothetical protein ACTHLJ_04405 [Angustibacter sp.]
MPEAVGVRLYLRVRSTAGALVTLGATAAVLVVLQLRSVEASVGILNTVDPGLAPWQALLPAVACPAFVGLSPASRPSVELVAPRATSRLDVALLPA